MNKNYNKLIETIYNNILNYAIETIYNGNYYYFTCLYVS